MENKVRGISDAIGRLALARTGSRFLVAGQTEADAEHRVPTGGESSGGDAVLRVRQIARLELSPCVECLDLTCFSWLLACCRTIFILLFKG